MNHETAYPCPSCQIGYCQQGTGTYLRMVDDTLLSAPDMTVWKCDICDYEEFDREAIMHLEALLGQYDTTLDSQRINSKLQSLDAPDSLATRRLKP